MSNTQPEPSMEEILASIRRIISEDEDDTRAPQTAPTAAQPRPRAVQAAPVQVQPQPAPRPQPQQSYQPEPQLVARPALEPAAFTTAPQTAARAPVPEPQRRPATVQTTTVQTAPATAAPQQQMVPQPAAQHPVVLQPVVHSAPRPVLQPAPPSAPQAGHQQFAKQVDMSHADVSENTLSETAIAAASKAFQSLSQKVKVSQAGEGRTLEDIVTEMLRPMVREWLEANLAQIVEEKVEAEVKRLARQGR